MAESKSKWFTLFINACSEKSRKFDVNPHKRLANISECRAGSYVAPCQGFEKALPYSWDSWAAQEQRIGLCLDQGRK